MAIIGFILSALLLVYLTFSLGAVVVIGLGFGGCPNPSDLALIIIGACVLAFGWYMLFAFAPFSIVAS